MIKPGRFLPCSSLIVLEKLTLVFPQVLFSQTKQPLKIPQNVLFSEKLARPDKEIPFLQNIFKKPSLQNISQPSFRFFLSQTHSGKKKNGLFPPQSKENLSAKYFLPLFLSFLRSHHLLHCALLERDVILNHHHGLPCSLLHVHVAGFSLERGSPHLKKTWKNLTLPGGLKNKRKTIGF